MSFSRVVFCDWHGVLCDEPFWAPVTADAAHPLHHAATAAAASLFADRRTVRSWMFGHLSDREALARHYTGPHADALLHELVAGCASMTPRASLVAALRALPKDTLRVLATDNMPCFAAAMPHNAALDGLFDAVRNSADVRMLKAQDPVKFFGGLLADHDLGFADAMLLDDNLRTCQRFRAFGGHAVRYHQAMDAPAALAAFTAA